MEPQLKVKNPRGNPEFKPRWQHLPTTAERFPVEFLPLLKDIARKLDNGTLDPKDLEMLLIDREAVLSEVTGNPPSEPVPPADPSGVILTAIDRFIDRQREAFGSNSAQKGEFSTKTSTYRHLLNFRSAVEKGELIERS